MPITQDRMLALLAAARDYQQAWDRAAEFAASAERSLAAGLSTPEEVARHLLLLLTTPLQLRDPVATGGTIARESEHFRVFKRRNLRAAERQRERRHGYSPGMLSPEVMAEIDRQMATPPVVEPSKYLEKEQAEAGTPDFEGELEL